MTRATHRQDHRSEIAVIGRNSALTRPGRIASGPLSRGNDLAKECRSGHVNVGAISGPAMSFVPGAIAQVAREYPLVRLRLQVESSDHLLHDLQAGRIEVMVGRLLEHYDTSNYSYTRLSDEPMCAVARKGHPLLKQRKVQMQDLAGTPWIVPQIGTILRSRFDLMFREAGYPAPKQIIEAVSQMVVPRLVQETNYLAILARDVAKHYASFGMISIVPIELPCDLDSFGVVTRKDRELGPAAVALCKALETAINRPTGSRQRPAQKKRI